MKKFGPAYKLMMLCDKRLSAIPVSPAFIKKVRYSVKPLYETDSIVGFTIDFSVKVESHPFTSRFTCTTPELNVTKMELGHWLSLVERFVRVADSYFNFVS